LELARASPDAQVVGVDISDAYIAYAASTKLPNLHFELGDATKLGFPDSSFDAVLSQLVLNFIPDYRQAAQEMKRVTKRDGIIAAAVWDFRGGLVYQRLLWDSIVSTDPPSAAVRDRLFSHPLGIGGGLESLWTEIGLAQIESRSLSIRMDFADFADYWEPLLGGQGPVGTYVAGLPPDQALRVREQVRNAYLSGAADGPRSMTATAWAVRGIVP
jgi:SAM-dependent methyltransferase